MIIDLLNNLAITTALLFVAGKIFEKKALDHNSPIIMKVLAGVGASSLAILLMYNTIKATDSVIVDLRHLPIIVAALYGGPISAIVSGTIVAIVRFFMMGISLTSFIAANVALLMGLFSAYVSKTRLSAKQKYIVMNVFCVAELSIAIFFLIDNVAISIVVFLYYWPISIFAGFFTYFVADYINKSNENTRNLKEIERDLRAKNLMLELLSNMDGVTQIYNRRYFDNSLQSEWQEAMENKTTLSLIMFDIDHFKSYNDTYGHQMGDECLKEIAKTAQSILKRPSDVVARYGGEEFAVILPNTSERAATKLAEKIRNSVVQLEIPSINSKVLPIVTLSIGVSSTVPNKAFTPFQLVANADEALYKAKSEGRNCVCLYDKSLLSVT
ncbi:diguanylate cyclase domain-containing protein [Pseudoneobacillus sp. C159]